jgi:hypothetical protein
LLKRVFEPTEADLMLTNFYFPDRNGQGLVGTLHRCGNKASYTTGGFFLRMVRMIELKGEGIECLTRKISNR